MIAPVAMHVRTSCRLWPTRAFAASCMAFILLTLVSCGAGSQPATLTPATSASATSSLLPSPTPILSSPSPSPQPSQRVEPSLPAALEESAAATAGGRLYVMGGFDAVGRSLSSVYVFDGTRWSVGPHLPIGLDHASAATLDDQLYLSGGHSGGADSARLFRLDGTEWTQLAPMHHARGGHALIAAGARLWAVGGNTAAGNVAAVEAYDPKTGHWTDVAELPAPRNHVAGFVFGSTVCAAGGRAPNTARIDCLDFETMEWIRLADLPRPTSGAGATTLDDGTVIVAGGEDAQESTIIDQVARSASGDQWTAGGPMLVARHGFELAIFEGRAWACGGGAAAGLHPVASCTSLI